ncbi:MAG: hypothetical protein V4629_06055 [Pseudomonadota bacterium]
MKPITSADMQSLIETLDQVEILLEELQQLEKVENKIEDENWLEYYFQPWQSIQQLWKNLSTEEQAHPEIKNRLMKMDKKQHKALDFVEKHQRKLAMELEKINLSREGVQAYNNTSS